jgi:glycine oxidase
VTAFDFIIVGQGLAGTALAWRLRWSGCRVLVLDRGDAITSSRIAAGLLTPITGKRLALTWRFADLWPVAVAFYRRVEAETGETFFSERPMVRLFQNDEEREVFAKRAETEFRGLVRQPEPLVTADWFANPLGGFEMTSAGQLATERYLDASRAAFERDGGFRVAEVDPSDIRLPPDGVRLPRFGVEARALIFCEGFAPRPNPWFPTVRFNAVKGEILTLRISGLTEERVVHRGVWLMPVGDEVFRAGSTYDRDALDCVPTHRGRGEIVVRLREFLRLPFDVIDHTAAVRPVVEDQRPVVGVHPEYPRLGIFNGLGSKGALHAPHFAGQLADLLTSRHRDGMVS